MTNAVTTQTVTPSTFTAALLKAVGWDRVPAEQRELAISICERYALDPMLRHVVMIEGRPYITRDGLLHVAHRSGVFDGIEVTDPALEGGYWRSRATVYRKDMSRGITYPGRYPEKGSNQRYGPEMSIKVGEVMALRRAFDVSAPVLEERWDLDETAAPEKREPMPLAAKVAARREVIEGRPTEAPPVNQCESMSPSEHPTRCGKEVGHAGKHANRDRETWPQEASDVGHPGASGGNVETPSEREVAEMAALTDIADQVLSGDVFTAMPIEVSAALSVTPDGEIVEDDGPCNEPSPSDPTVLCSRPYGHKGDKGGHRDDSGLIAWPVAKA
jgi:hypothetical protein